MPESGIHPQLPARVAALLLWLSGQEADEENAAILDPGIDRQYTYEKDYLPNPGRSFFALERRHARIALEDRQQAVHSRLQRTRELWLDPTFQPPPSFVEELRSAAADFDVAKLHRQVGRTAEELFFEELQPALARCAPDVLAALQRRKMESFASCPPESRYWSAVHANESFILAGPAEASAAQLLRLSAHENDDNNAIATSELIKIELQSLGDAQSQFDKLIAADLKFIPADFVEVMRNPSSADVDALIARYGAASAKQRRDLVVLLSFHPSGFSDSAWSWLVNSIGQPDDELDGVLFRMLTLADAARFGRYLAAEAWGWSPSSNIWVNHYGTGALIRAELALPFDQLGPRLAPWRLLEAARLRGADPTEVRLAAEIFGHVLTANKIEEPDPGSTLTVDRTERRFTPFFISVRPRPSPEERDNPAPSMRAALDADAQIKAHERAIETATARIDEARKSGASLYLTNVEAVDMDPVIQHASDIIDHWLEGSRDISTDFRRRVRLAETAFLALCEALLIQEPTRGAALWRALRMTVTTRYIGPAGIDELLHIVFRVPRFCARRRASGRAYKPAVLSFGSDSLQCRPGSVVQWQGCLDR
ncbi:hypothetical protein HZZ13_01265 [Bradyrhizobium sp. CNPSo 4010]|uniref:Uncharacterized protein n=1 Tax=Bradyrhizobium agreste TaxID=2751811 RepID=A0ABS0PGZ0_9BRAD|nr:hypothetical protein [Bradyrhizobium agreste]MBH5396444.1 hypothetical protein [Bradyrhizobium agreste]